MSPTPSDFNPGGFPLIIGNDVTVGHKVMLHGCEVGDQCLIGMCAVVMDGAVVEPQVILAAGSLVPLESVSPVVTSGRADLPSRHGS